MVLVEHLSFPAACLAGTVECDATNVCVMVLTCSGEPSELAGTRLLASQQGLGRKFLSIIPVATLLPHYKSRVQYLLGGAEEICAELPACLIEAGVPSSSVHITVKSATLKNV